MGTQNFPLSHARDKTKKYFSLFLYRAQNLPSLFSIYKHDVSDIADPSSMQDASHINFFLWYEGILATTPYTKLLQQKQPKSDIDKNKKGKYIQKI